MSDTKSSDQNTLKLGITMLTNDNNFGLGVYVIFMLWVGLSLAEVSFVISIWLLMHSIGQIPSGIFADRYGYKNSLIIGSVIFFGGTLLFATGQSFIWLLIGYALNGFGSAMKQGADYALLYEHLKEQGKDKLYKKLAGRLDFYTNIFWFVSGISGGLLYMYNARFPFYAEAGVAAIGIIACLLLIEPHRSKNNFSITKQIRESIETSFKTPHFSKIFIFSALIGSVAMVTLQYVQPLYQSLGIPEVYFGFIAAGFFIFRGLGSWFADKLGKLFSVDKYLILHAAVFGLFLVLIQRVGSIYLIFPILAVFYFLRGLYAPTISTFINDRVTSAQRATMLSINKQFLTVIAAVSVSGLAVIAENFGLQQVFFAISIMSIVFLISYVLSVRRVAID